MHNTFFFTELNKYLIIRHQSHLAKIDNIKYPFSILTRKYCNNYRHLDITSKYIIEKLKIKWSPELHILSRVINKISMLELLDFPNVIADENVFLNNDIKLCHVYRTFLHCYKTSDRENIGKIFYNYAINPETFNYSITKKSFLAIQLNADLELLNKPFIQLNNIGPGCIFPDNIIDSQSKLDFVYNLYENQDTLLYDYYNNFNILNIDVEKYTLYDIEHFLCEFRKYWNNNLKIPKSLVL